MEQTLQAPGRTWFGTLTLSEEWQDAFEAKARMAHPEGEAEWWDETRPVSYYCHRRARTIETQGYICDERFAALREQILPEVQRFWKRLRKAGHSFKYIVVFERHKTGLPHMHFLLHETGAPVSKRAIQAQWPFGFSNVSIVGGKSRKAVAPEKAAWYVTKYITKTHQSRVIASLGYKPKSRAIAK